MPHNPRRNSKKGPKYLVGKLKLVVGSEPAPDTHVRTYRHTDRHARDTGDVTRYKIY